MKTTTEETTATAHRLISPKTLAERWDISTATIYRWQRQGILDAIRIGGSVRYSLDQVEQLEQN